MHFKISDACKLRKIHKTKNKSSMRHQVRLRCAPPQRDQNDKWRSGLLLRARQRARPLRNKSMKDVGGRSKHRQTVLNKHTNISSRSLTLVLEALTVRVTSFNFFLLSPQLKKIHHCHLSLEKYFFVFHFYRLSGLMLEETQPCTHSHPTQSVDGETTDCRRVWLRHQVKVQHVHRLSRLQR